MVICPRAWTKILRLNLLSTTLLIGCVTESGESKVEVPPVHREQGNEYARDGLFREAIDQYRNALRKSPQDIGTRRNLGVVLVKIGDYKSAVKQLEMAMKRYESEFESNYYLAEAYRALGRYAPAIYRYQKALMIEKDEPRALKALAWSYFKIRYYGEALSTAKTLREIQPKDHQTSIILARTYHALRRYRMGLAVIRRAAANSEKHLAPYLQSVEGDLLSAMNRCDQATKSYAAALKAQPLLAGALLGLGRCHLQKGQTEPAIQHVERALRIKPALSEAHFILAKAYQSKNRQKSITHYRRFLKKASTDPEFLDNVAEARKSLAKLREQK